MRSYLPAPSRTRARFPDPVSRYYSPYPLHHDLADLRTETRTITRTRTEWSYNTAVRLKFAPGATFIINWYVRAGGGAGL